MWQTLDFGFIRRIKSYVPEKSHSTWSHRQSAEKGYVPGATVRHWLCTYARTPSGGYKLLNYDVAKLVKYGAIVSLFVKGTIFTMDWTMLQTLCRQGVLAFVVGLSTMLLDPNFAEKDVKGLSDLSQYLGAFTPFALGMYISLALSRWWSLRTQALAPVYNATANICMLLVGALPNVTRYNDVKDQVLKYGMCSVRLMVMAARDQHDIEEMLKHGLLDEEEYNIVESMDLFPRAMAMWPWIMRLCFHAFEECKIPMGVFNNVAKECVNARNGIQTIHTYCKTQVPLAYVHLILFVVNLNNVVVSVRCGLLVALAVRNYCNGKAEGKDFWHIVVYVAVWVTVPVIYQGLLAISYVVHDPFGEDILDFPVANFSEYVYQTCEAMYLSGEVPSEQAIFANSDRVQQVVQEMNAIGRPASCSIKARLSHWAERFSNSTENLSMHEPESPLVSEASKNSNKTSIAVVEEDFQDETLKDVRTLEEFLEQIEGLINLLQDLDLKLPDARAAKAAYERVEKQHEMIKGQHSRNDAERRKMVVTLENEKKLQEEGSSCVVGCQVPQTPAASDDVKEKFVETCSF